ncbi:FH2 domain containing 3 [Anguilla rostrata]|uniref:FH2 domain containing 3 n=1 Tax=Anguilla rostrata TaxID=7938 RepID=UPI0030CA7625
MRNFNWDAIPRQSVLGKRNVWTARRGAEPEDFPLDIERMEELFSHGGPGGPPKERPASAAKAATVPGRGGRGLPASAQASEAVSILNAKKSMNVGIFLKQFKRPMREMVEDIQQGNWLKFGTGKLRELSKHLPEEGEVKKLLAFRGDLCRLCEADLFMVLLVKVPSYEARIRSLVLREEFFPLIEEMKQSIAVMTTAAKELLDCDDLHSIIRLVLKAGNYMNAGGYAGSAIGFRMASLLKLVDTKANKPSMNLMHYVAMQAQKIDASLLKFPNQLQNIGAAARIQKQEVETDFKREVEKVKEAKEDSSKQPELESQMESFLRRAEVRLAEVEVSLQALDSVSQSVAEFFCEDPALFRLEECCSIFHSFCDKFMRAVQENREREVAEQKKRQRLQNAAKRRSVATCSGLDRDKDLEDVALEAVLEKFLSSRGSRRRGGATAPAGGSLADLGSGKMTTTSTTSSAGEPQPKPCPFRGAEARMNGWNSAQDLSVSASARTGEGQPRGADERRERAASIDSKTTPKGRDRARDRRRTDSHFYPGVRSSAASLVEEEEEDRAEAEGEGEKENEENKEEEVLRMREVSRRVLRYQSSRESLLPGQHLLLEPPRGPGGAATSPLRRDGEAPPPPRTVLSPRLPPRATPPNGHNRRHSPAVSPGDRLEKRPPAVSPRVPPPPLALVGRMKSLDSCLPSAPPSQPSRPAPRTATSLPDCPMQRAPSRGPTDVPPAFRFGDIFQKRANQGSERARPDRRGGSAFVSFFKRLGERPPPTPANGTAGILRTLGP